MIVWPEGVTTLRSETVDVSGPSYGISITTGIWDVLDSGVSVAFAVAGVATGAGDREHLWGGEENVGEGGLEALDGVVAGIIGSGVRVGVHELNPNFLDRSKLSQVELIIGTVDTGNGEQITTECIGIGGGVCDCNLGVSVVAVEHLTDVFTPAGARVQTMSAMCDAHKSVLATGIRVGKCGQELVITVGNITVGVLRRIGRHLDGGLVHNDLMDHIITALTNITESPAIVVVSNIFWELNLD